MAEEPELLPNLTKKWDQANKTASIMSQSMIIADRITPNEKEPETA